MSFIYNRSQQICKKLPTPSTGEIIPIYEPSVVNSNDTVTGLRYNGYITDLRIRSVVKSLAETPLPEFELGDSKTQKMAIVRDLEYSSPRFGLEVLLSCDGSPYLPIFEFAMHNRKPFFVTEVLSYLTNQPALALAPDASLAFRFKDVGYGFPTGQDDFVVYGVAREESIVPSVAGGTNLLTESLPLTHSADYPEIPGGIWKNELTVVHGAGLALLSFGVSSTQAPLDNDVVLSWDANYGLKSGRILVDPYFPPGYGSSTPFFFVIEGNSLLVPAFATPPATAFTFAVATVAFSWR